jgi:hypothetical protein
MSGQDDPLSFLAFVLPSAGWHLPNFMSPSQLYNKKRIWAAMHPALGGREKEGVGGGGREVGREGLVSSPASTSNETIPNTTLGGSCARAPADPAAPTSDSESERESLLGTNLHNNEESREGRGGGSRVSETGVQGEFSCCFSGSVSLGCQCHWEADMHYKPGAYPRILRDNLRVFRNRHWFYNAEDWQ